MRRTSTVKLKLQFQGEVQGASCPQGIEWIVYPNRSNPHTKLSKSRSDEVFLGKTQIQVVKNIERFHAEDQAEPFINGEVAVAFLIRDSWVATRRRVG
jgi:hypothetical protein